MNWSLTSKKNINSGLINQKFQTNHGYRVKNSLLNCLNDQMLALKAKLPHFQYHCGLKLIPKLLSCLKKV